MLYLCVCDMQNEALRSRQPAGLSTSFSLAPIRQASCCCSELAMRASIPSRHTAPGQGQPGGTSCSALTSGHPVGPLEHARGAKRPAAAASSLVLHGSIQPCMAPVHGTGDPALGHLALVGDLPSPYAILWSPSPTASWQVDGLKLLLFTVGPVGGAGTAKAAGGRNDSEASAAGAGCESMPDCVASADR